MSVWKRMALSKVVREKTKFVLSDALHLGSTSIEIQGNTSLFSVHIISSGTVCQP